MSAARALTAGQRDWLRVRSYLGEHRYGLAVDAARDYPAVFENRVTYRLPGASPAPGPR